MPPEGLFTENSVLRLLFDAKKFDRYSDDENTKSSYKAVVNNQEIQKSFQDFAKFKLLLLSNDDLTAFEDLLNQLITPDNPYRLLAMEQKVLVKIKNGDWTGAQETIDLIIGDPDLTQGLRSRTNQIQKVIKFGSK